MLHSSWIGCSPRVKRLMIKAPARQTIRIPPPSNARPAIPANATSSKAKITSDWPPWRRSGMERGAQPKSEGPDVRSEGFVIAASLSRPGPGLAHPVELAQDDAGCARIQVEGVVADDEIHEGCDELIAVVHGDLDRLPGDCPMRHIDGNGRVGPVHEASAGRRILHAVRHVVG